MGWSKSEVAERLEQLLDQQGLPGILEMLAEVCRQKAEHARVNWQDVPLATEWGRAAAMLERVATRIAV